MCMVDDAEPFAVYVEEWRKCAKPFKCCECGREVAKGERYSFAKGLYDGYWETFKMCPHCKTCDCGDATEVAQARRHADAGGRVMDERRATTGDVSSPPESDPSGARSRALEEALRRIAAAGCHNYTAPEWACLHYGERTLDAEFTAYRICDACAAHQALVAVGRSQEQEQDLGGGTAASDIAALVRERLLMHEERQRAERAEKVLFALEWIWDEGAEANRCPACGFLEGRGVPELRGHDRSCSLGAVLAAVTTADSVGVREDRSAVGRLPGEPPAPQDWPGAKPGRAEALYDAVHELCDEGRSEEGDRFSFPAEAWWKVVHAMDADFWNDESAPVPQEPPR